MQQLCRRTGRSPWSNGSMYHNPTVLHSAEWPSIRRKIMFFIVFGPGAPSFNQIFGLILGPWGPLGSPWSRRPTPGIREHLSDFILNRLPSFLSFNAHFEIFHYLEWIHNAHIAQNTVTSSQKIQNIDVYAASDTFSNSFSFRIVWRIPLLFS